MARNIVTARIAAPGDAAVLHVGLLNAVAVAIEGGDVAATGVNLTFEASVDSTNGTDGSWFPVQAVRTNANTVETATGVLALGVGVPHGYGYRANAASYAWFRVRSTAITAGAVEVTIRGSRFPIEPAPVTPTHGVTQSGTWTDTPVTPTPGTFVTAASTNAGFFKATAGTLTGLLASNPTATAAYLKLYNKATAPTVGTDVPVITLEVPAGKTVPLDCGLLGLRFTTGIARAVTAGAAATDTAVAVAGVQVFANWL